MLAAASSSVQKPPSAPSNAPQCSATTVTGRRPDAVSSRSSLAHRAANVWPDGPSGPSGLPSPNASFRGVTAVRKAFSVVGRSANARDSPASTAAVTTGVSCAMSSLSES